MTGSSPFDPKDGIYQAILMVLVTSVIAGALLALLGELYFRNEAVKQVGVGAVVISGAIYFFFRLLGRREAARRRQASNDADEGRDDPGPDQS